MSIEIMAWLLGGSGLTLITFLVKIVVDYTKLKHDTKSLEKQISNQERTLQSILFEKDTAVDNVKKDLDTFRDSSNEKFGKLYDKYENMSLILSALTENIKNLREETKTNNEILHQKIDKLLTYRGIV